MSKVLGSALTSFTSKKSGADTPFRMDDLDLLAVQAPSLLASLQECKNGLGDPWAFSYRVNQISLIYLFYFYVFTQREMKAPVHTKLVH